jgi:hypothetical protein
VSVLRAGNFGLRAWGEGTGAGKAGFLVR